ncbi:epoxide hydrolase 2 [Lophiostoma macrostomum CBS 122681]|uniref:Epoxide hydrolase 2 n=1 Tax=Lophiostoma macrostomum CBS 122681 TaxID=1314788 RepID=A0A6A6SQL0_9PLEO|nr:epoxide hydrolase 2 [Lophiostoma macrostomum CBS 122681]
MDSLTTDSIAHSTGETTYYYEGGSKEGIPLVFIHGWPDLAQTWHHQLTHFSATSTYRVLAPDMRGYGNSSSPDSKRAYSLEVIVSELVNFTHQLGFTKAIWVAHDWGCGAVSALAAHHPSLFLGMVSLSVPYRTIELGLDHLVSLVNRDIYPEEQYPYGQWTYMKHYELHTEECIENFKSAPLDKITKARYRPHDPARFGKPGRTSTVSLDRGWLFGGRPDALPDIPLGNTLLDESLYESLLAGYRRHGFFPQTAWYLNHDVNAEYAKSEVNGGVLEFPVLYIDAKHDAASSAGTTPKMGQSQRNHVRDLTIEVIESEHWVQLERPEEVNRALERWLATAKL